MLVSKTRVVCNSPEYPENASFFNFLGGACQTSQLLDGRPVTMVTLICLSLDTALVIGYQISNKYYA